MRISDWSSDVCSSDLTKGVAAWWRQAAAGKAKAPTSKAKALFDDRRVFALAFHTLAEARIVESAAPHLPDQAQHVRRLQRHMRLQPFAEKIRHFVGPPQPRVAGAPRTGVAGRRQQRFHSSIIDARNSRHKQHQGWHAGV